MNRNRILTICAHPDDTEFRCGGILLLLARQGWKVDIATLTSGDCGSMQESPNAIAVRRAAEAQAAAKRLGGRYHCLGGQDLQVYDNNEMRAAAIALVREVDPACVVTHYPWDYMPDHDVASAVARTAVFCATMPNYVVGPAAYHRPTQELVPLYYFGTPMGGSDYFGNPVQQAHFFVDISSVIEEKAELLACHASQREWLREQHGMDQYLEAMRAFDARVGAMVGVKYAEVFAMHKGEPYPHPPLLQEALAEHVRQGG